MPVDDGELKNVLIPPRIASNFVPPVGTVSVMEPETSANRYKFAKVHGMHTPVLQTPLQGLLHPPQWAVLVMVSTHCPPQNVKPLGQMHMPFKHPAPSGHWTLQPPQLSGSFIVLTQLIPQGVPRQVQKELTHE